MCGKVQRLTFKSLSRIWDRPLQTIWRRLIGSRGTADVKSRNYSELSQSLLEIIIIRAVVLLLGLNLADSLGLLPSRLGAHPFLWFFNTLALMVTLVCLFLWQISSRIRMQLFAQIGLDLILTTVLVAYTRGIQSAFVSFYLLIIIYCSLTLGRNGGMVGAALSTILYSGIVAATRLGVFKANSPAVDTSEATFRISFHALGFWAVAYLGTYLHQRLQRIEGELKEKIASIRELKHLNEHIVSSIRSGLITTDLHGSVTVFNSAAKELTGREPEEIFGRPVELIIGSPFWKRILNSDLFMNAKALRHEEWLTLPGGRKRYLGFSVSPLLDQFQQLLGYIISFQDLTEITRLEEELRLKARMAAIGRMAAGIAHEIRNPLMAMRGSVEILRSHSNLPKSDERLLGILIRESDRLNGFVEDFLNYARPRRYEQRSLDLVPVLRDSVMLLRNSPEIRDKHQVTLNVEAQSIRIIGSGEQLNQVFWNLAQNAIRAMPKGGELNISIRKNPNNSGEIVFQDNGVGMTREQQEQMFQPFYSGVGSGLGLGLTIVFQIIEDHRGRISFESEPGKGTRVSLCFPLENNLAALEKLERAVNA
jgi:two-component system sensor histidine kinase PilS (NtrC family)